MQPTAKVYFSSNDTSPRFATQKSSFVKSAETAAKKPTALERFEPGDIVEHASFGKGEILSVKEMGSDILYEIIFERVGTKKLMATYARLKKSK